MTYKTQEALKLADELDAEFAQGRISNHTGRKAAQFIREALMSVPDGAQSLRDEEQPAYRAVKTFHEGKPVYVAEQPAIKQDLTPEQPAPVAEPHEQQEPKPKFVRNVDGVPCITLVEHEHLMRSRSKPAQQEPKVLLQEIARLHDRIKDLEQDVEFLSRPAQQGPWVHATTWRGLTDEELSKLVSCTKWRSDESMHTYAVRACRAVEAKLREKNA